MFDNFFDILTLIILLRLVMPAKSSRKLSMYNVKYISERYSELDP